MSSKDPSYNIGILHKRYPDLHKSEEVRHVINYLKENGEHIINDREPIIASYLGFLASIVDDGFITGEKDSIDRQIEAHAITPQNVPESYFDLQKRILREQGYGDVEITEESRAQMIEVIRSDQTGRLHEWVEYLTDIETDYPDWFKYYTIQGVLSLTEYDKEHGRFKKRSKSTTEPFPALNQEALAMVYDETTSDKPENHSSNFSKLYAETLAIVEPTFNPELLKTNQGEWVKYAKGNPRDIKQLVESLKGKATGWCTAGKETAANQLARGDFYVFYSYDDAEKASIPRIAIRMMDGFVAEVRGIETGQNLEQAMLDAAKAKVETLPGGERYAQAVQDMQLLTEIERMTKAGEELSVEELHFLYESTRSVISFGYGKDPRIGAIKNMRSDRHDYARIHDIDADLLATNYSELTPETEIFLGNFPFSRLGKSGLAKYPNLREFIGEQQLNNLRVPRFTQDDALRLIDMGLTREVSSNFQLFIDTDPELIIDYAIEKQAGKDLYSILYSIRTSGHRLAPEYAQKLIVAGAGDSLLRNIDVFETLSEHSLIDIMVDLAKPSSIEWHSVHGLTQEGQEYLLTQLEIKGRIGTMVNASRGMASIDQDSFLERLINDGHALEVVKAYQPYVSYRGRKTISHKLSLDAATEQLVVTQAVQSGEIERLLPKLISVLSEDKLLDILALTGQSKIVIDNISQFQNADPKKIAGLAKELLDENDIDRIVADIRAKKRNLTPAMAQILIQSGKGVLVVSHFGQFKGIEPKSFITQLLSRGEGRILDKNIYKFENKGLDREIIDLLVEHEQFMLLAKNPTRFSGVTQEDIIQILADHGQINWVFSYLYRFSGLSKDTLEFLEERGLSPERILDNLSSFVVVGDSVALACIASGRAEYVIENLNRFDLSPQVLADVWRSALRD